MAVSLFYGMTESGKSSLAKSSVSMIARAVIFDYSGKSFDGGDLITSDFSIEGMIAIFQKFKDRKKFKIIFRPKRTDNDETSFNKVAMLSLLLGRQAIKRGDVDRLVLVIDEADMICSSSYQSRELKYLVNIGRHDGVDSWFIARIPQRLHTDARSNASRLFCFKLTDDTALGYIKKAIGKKSAEKIRSLEQYSFLAWKDTGLISVYDRNKKIIESWS